jgi:hypothetical protein
MGCCAFGTCPRSKANGGRGCRLCDVIARLPKNASVLDLQKADLANPIRDGNPKLAGERKRSAVSIKRQRQGPNYVPPNRRV